jgi:hypothetical protein
MAQHAGQLGQQRTLNLNLVVKFPEHDVKLLNTPPKIHHQTKDRNTWQQEEKQYQ